MYSVSQSNNTSLQELRAYRKNLPLGRLNTESGVGRKKHSSLLGGIDLLNPASFLICNQSPSLAIHEASKLHHFISLQHHGEGKLDLENPAKQL